MIADRLKKLKPSISPRAFNNYIKFLQKCGESEQLEFIDRNLYETKGLDYII